MNNQAYQAFLKGKVFLIQLSFFDPNEKLIEIYQTVGIVEEMLGNGLIRFRRREGGIFQLPYDEDVIEPLTEGEYKETKTGEKVAHPDYMMKWQINVNTRANLEDIKLRGYMP